MRRNLFILFLVYTCRLTEVAAQEWNVFSLNWYEDSTQIRHFISLSDIYPVPEDPDARPIPDLSEKDMDEAPAFRYFTLDPIHRQRLLTATHISENDSVFVYTYATDALRTFAVKNLKAIACLNFYGPDWPYSPDDYMIGFEINRDALDGFDANFNESFVCIGTENPFVRGQLEPIIWTPVARKDFPSKELPDYDTLYAGVCTAGDTYVFETGGLQYFVQDLLRVEDQEVRIKHLHVIDSQTHAKVCEELFYAGEGQSFAPLDHQWTGTLFKHRPPVIFDFMYVSFGCPGITFLAPEGPAYYIRCDNRH
jgi:hypothetical protein